MTPQGLYSEIEDLAAAFENIPRRSKAAIFGACARPFMPLLQRLQEVDSDSWSLSVVSAGLAAVFRFAEGAELVADHAEMRSEMMGMLPGAYDLEAPLNTCVQDALICIDAGLAAASFNVDVKSMWIQYVIEPLAIYLQIRDAEVFRRLGEERWSSVVMEDPQIVQAVAFLRSSIPEVASNPPNSHDEMMALAARANILVPPGFRGEDW